MAAGVGSYAGFFAERSRGNGKGDPRSRSRSRSRSKSPGKALSELQNVSGTAGSSDVLADVKNTLAENQVAEAVHKRRPSAGCILSGGQKKDPPTDPVQERSTLARPVHKGSAIMDKRKKNVAQKKLQVTLSSLLGKIPQQFDRNKVSVVDRCVTVIDRLPDRYLGIKTLYMSNNSVSNLEGLSQFSQLENLSLANNCVSDVRQLDVLAKACPSLESLMLEGNPVASGPNYRAQVVLRLPTLKTLDGLEVTDQERDRALTTVRQEQGMLDIMITNDCLLQKLEHVSRLQHLHMDLRASPALGRLSALQDQVDERSQRPRSMHRLLQLWDLEKYLSPEERRRVCRKVQNEAKRLRHHQDAAGFRSWDACFCEVITQQQTAASRLVAAIENRQAEAEKVWELQERRDPKMTLMQLRHSQSQGQAQLSQDREALINEFREAAFDLMDGVVEQQESAGRRSNGHVHNKPQATRRFKGADAVQGASPPEAGSNQGREYYDGRKLAGAASHDKPLIAVGKREYHNPGSRPDAEPSMPRNQGSVPGGAFVLPESSPHGPDGPLPRCLGSHVKRSVNRHILHDSPAVLPEHRPQQSANPTGQSSAAGKPMQDTSARVAFARERESRAGSPVDYRSSAPEEGIGMSSLLLQVNQLQGDLEAHMRGELHLQEINMQLRRMLETTQQRLQESALKEQEASKAETDLKSLQRQMEDALQAQKRLEERTQRLASEKQIIEDTARKAAFEVAKAEKLAESANNERDELQRRLDAALEDMTSMQAIKEEEHRIRARNEELEAELARLSSAISEFEAEAKTDQRVGMARLEAVSSERDALQNQCQEQKAFLSWHETRMTEMQIKLEQYKSRETMEAEITRLSRRVLLRRSMFRFREGVRHSSRVSWLKQKAANLYYAKALRTWLRKWRLAVWRLERMDAMKLTREKAAVSRAFVGLLSAVAIAKAEHINMQVAGNIHSSTLTRRAWKAWMSYVSAFMDLESDKSGFRVAGKHHYACLIRKVFSAWHGWLVNVAKPKLQRSSWAATHFNAQTLRRAFAAMVLAWREGVQERVDTHIAESHLRAKLWQRWRASVAGIAKARLQEASAERHYASVLVKRGVSALSGAVHRRHVKNVAWAMASDLYRTKTRERAFVGWWEIMQQSREDRRVLSVVEAHKEFRRTICANAADVLARLRLKSFQVLVLRSWWWCIKFCQCQQRLANHQELQAARFSHRRVFVAWRSTSRLLKGEDADQDHRKQVELLEAEMMELKQQLEQVTQAMQSETRAAEAHEFRLASLAKELEAALSESIENENSLRAEAEDLRERLNGAREEAASAQERQNRLVAAEAAAREAEIRGLQAQLDEQVKILRDCEAALKNSAKRQLEELAGKDAELRQREELDAGLRELVGVRENQAQQLTSRVEQLQRQLKDRDSEASLASSEISSLKTRLEEQEQMLLEQKRKARALEADATEGKAALAEVASLRNRLKESDSEVRRLLREVSQAKAGAGRASASAKLAESNLKFRNTIQSARSRPEPWPGEETGAASSSDPCDHAAKVKGQWISGGNGVQPASSAGIPGPANKSAKDGSSSCTGAAVWRPAAFLGAQSSGAEHSGVGIRLGASKAAAATDGVLDSPSTSGYLDENHLQDGQGFASRALVDFNWGDKPALMVQGRETFAIEGKENRAENLRGLDLWRNRLGVSGASEAERREDENKMLAVGQYPLSPYGSSRNKQVTEREPASPLSPATQREASDLHSKILCLKERIASQAALTTPLGSPPSSETDRGLDPDASLHSWGFLGQVSE